MLNLGSGTVLDVAIGLAVMYLMLSLVGTTCNEIFATIIGLRAKTLSITLESIIDNEDLRKDFYNSGLIAGVNDAIGTKSSYISSKNFADAILNSLDPSKSLAIFADISRSVQLMPDSNIRDVLLAQIAAANGDLDALRSGVAEWFDSAMDRVSGLYKRNIKYIALAFGLAIAVVFNADTIVVCKALWQDKDLRATMVTLANKQLEAAGKTTNDAPADPKNPKDLGAQLYNLRATYDTASDALKPLPIGWGATTFQPDSQYIEKKDYLSFAMVWFLRFGGWLISGLAISLGAPFWFDLLSKFMNIRGSGDKPSKIAST